MEAPQNADVWHAFAAAAAAAAFTAASIIDALQPGVGLERNAIGDAGAAELAKALARNQTLRALILERNRIGDTGAAKLAEALVHNKT